MAARRYRLLGKSFHEGQLKERGAIVTLLPHERPGRHMVPVREMAPTPELHISDRHIDRKNEVRVSAVAEPPKQTENYAEAMQADLAPQPGYLILDTETNGFAEPRMASIAMIFVGVDFQVEHEYAHLIRPDGWEMSQGAAKVNGLTIERLEAEGISPVAPLHVISVAVALGRTIVAHNLAFDLRVLDAEMTRVGLGPIPTTGICTLKKARSVGVRATLAGALADLTGRELLDAHDALVDARACLDILRELFMRGAI